MPSLKLIIIRAWTRLFVLFLRFQGKKIRVGKNTLIHPLSIINVGTGILSIGSNCIIHRSVLISTKGGKITIGDRVSINHFSLIYGISRLEIGNDVRIAGQVSIVPADHGFLDKNKLIRKQSLSCSPIIIGSDVWIGSGAKILAGAKISDGCVIGANSVIKSETKPYSVYTGIPAKKIKERE